MSTIEERIVAMKFDGAAFLTGVDRSLTALDKLNSKLKMENGTKGFTDIGSAADKQSGALSRIATGVENISNKFKVLSVIGITALTNIANKAVDAGLNLAKALTIDPVVAGFQNYETQIKAVQTILANTQAQGTKLKDVNAVLSQLNDYANKTVYNFSQMAESIGTFTAAGVKLKPAAESIKGIANLAALSGASSEQASNAMYQLSQAIAAGKVSLQDWNSVVNAGLGGKTFQDALVNTARASGVAIDALIKKSGSFRNSLQKGWLTSDILTKTLAQFTGDLTEKQLKSMGFSEQQAKAILKVGQTAVDAATKIKTASQLTEALKEEVATAWAGVFKTIFGDIGQATDLFSKIHNVAESALTAPVNSLNNLLKAFSALGGRQVVIKAITNAFTALGAILRPIKQAFREIFPPTTAKELLAIATTIEKFTEKLKIGADTSDKVKRTFAGLFAVLDIGGQIIKQIIKVVFDLLGMFTKGSGGVLNFTANIGDFLVSLDKAIKSGNGLGRIFGGLEKVLSAPIKLLKILSGYLGSLFDGFNGNKAAKNIVGLTNTLDPLGKIGKVIGVIWGHAEVIFQNIWSAIQKVGQVAKTVFGPFAQQLSNAFSGFNYKDFLSTINTGLFGGLVILLKKFVDRIKGESSGGGFLSSIKESIEELTGTLKAMQSALKATALLEIAAAIGILAIALNVLAKIDAGGLTRGSVAIGTMFTELIVSLIAFQKISGFKGFLKMPFVAAAMILMATAIDILATAMNKMAGLDWNSLIKGLTGVGALLGSLVAAMQLMPDGKRMISASLGMIALAAAVKILVGAVSYLAGLTWGDLIKGLVGVGAILGALTLFTKFAEADKAGVLSGAGLVLLAAGVSILAKAVANIAKLSWSEIARGLVALTGALGILVAALVVIPPDAVLGAGSILLVSLSLGKVASALQVMGSMSWGDILKGLVAMLGALTLIAAAVTVIPPEAPLGAASILIVADSLGAIGQALTTFSQFSWSDIGKAMVVLAGSLTIIALAMVGMTEALPGAAALVVVAASLAILAPVMVTLGAMTWDEIVKGLVALAGALTVIGVAAALLTPVIPSLIGLGAGVALLGAAMALAGAGVFLFATGLTLLAASGVAAAAALVGMITIIIGAVPQIVQLVGALLVALADLVIQTAPKMGQAFLAVMSTMLTVIGTLSPQISEVLAKLLTTLVESLAKYVPRMVNAGTNLIVGLLNGIAGNIGRIVTAGTNVAVAFINGVGQNLPRIINAGLNLVVNFVNGLANGIRSHTGAMRAAGINLAMAIIDGMTGGLASGIGRIVSKAEEIAQSALGAARRILGINSPSKEFEKIGAYVIAGFRKGLDGNKGQIDSAFNSLKAQLKSAMSDSERSIESLTEKLNKLEKARHKNRDAIRDTKNALAEARKEHAAEVAAYKDVNSSLSNSHTKLGQLANQYDVLTGKIKAATDAYNNAVKTRDDFKQSITQEFSSAVTPQADQTVSDYISKLQKQVEDTKTFANTIQQLRKLGLNDDAYKQLLQAGIADLPFVQNLLAGGKDAVDQINSLQTQLTTTASSLGQIASSQLYQAAVDSAAGLVKGLQNQQAAIEKVMDAIADAMVRSIKKKLGIKSPSRVFAEVGKFSAQGLSQGLEDSADIVANSASSIGNKAVEAMRVSLSDINNMAVGNIDLQPSIRPVLDLTDIQKNAGKISDLLPTNAKMSVVGASSNASAVASSVNNRNNGDTSTIGNGTSGPTVNYTQNNYSPKALSPVEIYRGTKNQLSTVKGALSTG